MSVLLAWQIFQRLEMGNLHEQCVCVKFFSTLGKTYSHTLETLKPAFEEAMIRTQTHE
jgi:hypothetical protein